MPSTVPVVPPRPSRSPRPGLSAPSSDAPKIPPRPSNRRLERSTSPGRDSFAPSPLNEIPGSAARPQSRNDPSSNRPSRPSSVTLPSLGQEGMEYEDINVQDTLDNSSEVQEPPVEQKRDIGSDVKLHAPRPSLPSSTARAKVQAVTHTNSQQAAAAGFGKAVSPGYEQSDFGNRADSRTASSTAPSIERRSSVQHGDEHGIPEIGQQVPMYPNAGDVQAPSVPPHPSTASSTRPGRGHRRTGSGRDSSQPPGSYGLHGHGVQSNDRFEKAWYDKHPDELAREEQGQYGPGLSGGRPESALSSDELNRIVRDSASRGSGLGTSSTAAATPEEELGYIASEEFTSRLTSPRPTSRHIENTLPKDSQAAVESPLRQSSFPATEPPSAEDEQLKETSGVWNEAAETEGVIHIDEPYHHQHHPDGFAPAIEDRGQHGAHASIHEREDDVSVLASDEVEPNAEHMHPAISPTFEGKESGYFGNEQEVSRSATSSKLSNRPTRERFNSRGEEGEAVHTPLDDVEEYEPLFPEDEGKEGQQMSAADRFKQRPGHIERRFPSQDVWEDTPNSLQLHTTVSTPDVPSREDVQGSVSAFESPDQEAARKEGTEKADTEKLASQIQDSKSHLEDETAERPDTKHRFPSKDVWEDAPESLQLVTTVQTPEPEDTASPAEVPSKPAVPPRPDITKAPPIPSRPQKRVLKAPPFDSQTKPPLQPTPSGASQNVSPTESRKPVLPDRPKPQIPARPARPARDSSESLSKVNSRGSAESGDASENAPAAPSTKAKPVVPSKPGGSKIAALKAGFLSDLDKRLQLGPKPPEKKEEPKAPAEKGPLSDARKGRARGPARRKPAVAATPQKVESPPPAKQVTPEIKITGSWNVWQINEDGAVVVGENELVEKSPSSEPSSSAEPPIKKTASDIVESTSPEADEDKASPATDSPTNESPTDESPNEEADKPSPLPSAVDNPLPSNEATKEPDEDKAETEEEPRHPETASHDTAAPGKKPSPFPSTSQEDMALEDEESVSDKDLEQMSASADGKRSSDGTLKFDQAS
ncbi:hypothetical protein FQN54_003973 [Arachnomyces sp. PD_36]|nr:hypothetical protein FQN54_003973 [Arachnomyces sp. PD_36]